LQRRAVPVCLDHLGRGLTSRRDDDVSRGAPPDDVGQHDRRDDELGPGIDRRFGVRYVHYGPAPDHDLGIVPRPEVGEVMETVRRGQREFDDFEPPVDAGLHGLRTRRRCRRAQDCTRAYGREGL